MPYQLRPSVQPDPRFSVASVLRAGFAFAALSAALTACGGGGGSSTPVTPIGTTPAPIGAQPSPSPTATATATPAPIGAQPTPTPTGATPSASPTPTPGPDAVIVSPSSLSFVSVPAAAQTVVVKQIQNSSFALTTKNCAGIVSLAVSTGPGPFAFTPTGAGQCTYLVTGANGQSTSLAITVTTTSIVPSSARRTPRQ